jgi:hypothetical protein
MSDIAYTLNKECLQLYLQLVSNGKLYTKLKPNDKPHPITFFLTKDCELLYWMSKPTIGRSVQKHINCTQISTLHYNSNTYILTISTPTRILRLCMPSIVDMMQLHQVLLVCKQKTEKV